MQEISLKGLPEWFETHPMTQKIINENKEAIAARRAQLREQINRLRQEQQEKLKDVEARFQEAYARLQQKRDELQMAERDYRQADHEKYAVSLTYTSQIERLENEMYDLAPAEIEECKKFLLAKLEKVRKEGLKVQNFPGKVDLLTQKRKPFTYSNIEAVNACVNYLQNAIHRVEHLKLQDSANLSEQLEKIKKGIPSIDKMVLYEKND